MNGNEELTTSEIAVRPAQLADELRDIPTTGLASDYAILRARWMAYGYMMSCSASILIKRQTALDVCNEGIAASNSALTLIKTAEQNRSSSQKSRDVWDWVETEHMQGRVLRDYATMNVLAYQKSQVPSYRDQACAALKQMFETDPNYAQLESAQSSPILRTVLHEGGKYTCA